MCSIEAEYRRYKALAEGAMAQLSSEELCSARLESDNSIATLVWHISGNLKSRFTDFLTADGEKEWRNRESEFEGRDVTREVLLAKWDEGWRILFAALEELSDSSFGHTVLIRGVPLKVHEALHRSLAHASYHVGQIVQIAKAVRGSGWESLSIPPGQSEAYRDRPSLDRPLDQVKAIDER
ncbi:MAG: DUF1572 domain-containing protein [Gemmatimonadetes bacterium]|nr:DUF1572 domain-containing protein [Gemmatimonadota bacterium]